MVVLQANDIRPGAAAASRPDFTRRLLRRLERRAADGARWLRTIPERSAQRRALAALDDRQLRDIGITRAEADAEIERLVWRS